MSRQPHHRLSGGNELAEPVAAGSVPSAALCAASTALLSTVPHSVAGALPLEVPFPQASWRAWPRHGLMLLVRGYRLFLSPWLGSSCRFEPTCSRYALQALERHGAAAGSYLTARRLLRCHPWCAAGFDAVPHERPRLFRHLFAEASGPAPQPEPAAVLSELPIASRPLP